MITVALTKEQFATMLHTPFTVQLTPTRPLQLDLVSLYQGFSAPEQDLFILRFRGPLTAIFGQGTWTLHHDQIGAFALFLVPVYHDQQGMYYEAVCNGLLTH